MRFVNADGRGGLLVDGDVYDVNDASGGRLPADPMVLLREHWADMLALHDAGVAGAGRAVEDVHLGPPVPRPSKIFGIGLNYRAHAEESGSQLPEVPAVFTKFPNAVSGPYDDVALPDGTVDYEAELCFVVGQRCRRVRRDAALSVLAGFCAANDVSERGLQFAAGRQFSMGKSYDTFCPVGPAIVTLDEIPHPASLAVRLRRNGELMQDGNTADLIFDVPALVEFLSGVCTLEPGDLCLTGTPAGVGMARQPPVWLQPGDVLETEIEGVGVLRNRCVAQS